jgi:hypothetical protein
MDDVRATSDVIKITTDAIAKFVNSSDVTTTATNPECGLVANASHLTSLCEDDKSGDVTLDDRLVHYVYLTWVLWRAVPPMIAVLGTVGNVLTMVVMSRRRLRLKGHN